MLAHMTRNTDKEYPCTNCGEPGNIIREGDNPRLKCMSCGFMYNASDSLEMVKRGEVPNGPPEIEDKLVRELPRPNEEIKKQVERVKDRTDAFGVPKTPSYVFISKDGNEMQFCTKKEFKRVALRWEQTGNYKCYQLQPIKVSAKIEVI